MLNCFTQYDVRGEIAVDFDEDICTRVGGAFVHLLGAKRVVLGWDARETSPKFADAVAKGLLQAGVIVLDIGLSGTEEMYWAVNEYEACGGFQVTASHNPIKYNGLKIVKAGPRPLNPQTEFKELQNLVRLRKFERTSNNGRRVNVSMSARRAYVKKILSFAAGSELKPLKVVVNSGNGAAGPTFDAIAKQLGNMGCQMEFIRIHHNPDHTFPNGVPNPMLIETHSATARVVRRAGANFGVAFDGDFDRCAFFDEKGKFVSGECIVGLLAGYFLKKSPNARIAHDRRVVWAVEDVVLAAGGTPVPTIAGHAYFKTALRETGAIYGGEVSHHHYFREFACCDSGMIPWLVIAQIMSLSDTRLSDLVAKHVARFPSSGEHNFMLDDPQVSIERVVKYFMNNALTLDETDGVTMTFKNWRFNLRCSQTEPLVRLNIETTGNRHLLSQKLKELSEILTK